MSNSISPHDTLFKATMARPKVARLFLQEHLPEQIKKLVDLDTLKQEPINFTDEAMQKCEADVLYSARFAAEQGYIYVLFEHLSNPDKMLAVRLVKYMLRIIEWHMAKRKTGDLCPIYPLIVYTGAKKYTYSTSFFDSFGNNKKLMEDIFLQPFHFLDIKDIPDRELRKNMILGLMVKAMLTNAREPADLLKALMPYLSLLKNDVNFIRIVITYIAYTKDIDSKNKFFDELTTLLPTKTKGTIMTIAEQLKQEGLREGKQEGLREGKNEAFVHIAKTLLADHEDIMRISKLTGLPLSKIKSLKRQIH